jgi:pimeloyl-ACP methyl ester carboxylesterase
MRFIATIILGLALVVPGETAIGAVAPEEFQGWFESAAEGSLHIPNDVAARAARYRYVLIGGFGGESIPGYFTQNVKELRAAGVPREAIHLVRPSSDETLAGNAESVRAALRSVARNGPEPLVIVAHSRGACDALAFALAEPAFIRDHVRALFLVQGPFGGSGLADIVTGAGAPVDGRLAPLTRMLINFLVKIERYFLAQGRHGGLSELTHQASRAYWTQLLDEHKDALPIVGPKTFYITSATRPNRLGVFRRAAARYLSVDHGENDGVVAVRDQSLPELGTTLGVLHAAHADLVQRFPAARGGRRLRKALIQSILMSVGTID